MVERCWNQDPAQRPKIFEVLRFFKNPDLLFASRYAQLFIHHPWIRSGYLRSVSHTSRILIQMTMDLRRSSEIHCIQMIISCLLPPCKRTKQKPLSTFLIRWGNTCYRSSWSVSTIFQALDYINGDPELLRKCLRALRKICGLRLQLPSSYDIPKMQLIRKGKDPFAIGGCSDVWAGTFGRRKVAIKCLRIIGKKDSAKIMKASVEDLREIRQLTTINRPSVRKL